MPAVIENAPFLSDGRPMPTRYWLVDPGLREAVSRLEAKGGVRAASTVLSAHQVAAAHAEHAAQRDRLVPAAHEGPRPHGGVGGTRRGIKCLHAHLAWYLAGGDDPVGRWTAQQLGIESGAFELQTSTTQFTAGPVAAVDCGTNSTRLLVADDAGRALERQMQITRLGEGVDATGRIAAEASDRTLSVLSDYRQTMDRHGVERARVIATSAVRDAENAEMFLSRVADVMRVPPEVLSGDEEGSLSFVGATAHLPDETHSGLVLVVDIGGGSTEFSVGNVARDTTTAEVSTRSLDIGCVRVSERFLHSDPPRPDELENARRMLEAEVQAARAALPVIVPDSLFVGLAGTVSTLSCLEQGVVEYDRDRIHHSVLTKAMIDHWLGVLSSEDVSARLRHPGMVKGREDVIVGGTLILATVMACFELERCLVSEDDILDGLAATLLDPL
jgi:exopolyphosphatase/guanosine-5'-triphosphate,3'-diphosphate pyrophosphatase